MGVGRQLLKNILTSWVAFAVRLVIGFLFVPFIASIFGTERYGIWVIIFQAVSYLTLFDLGLERAVIRFVARYHSKGERETVSQTLSTSQGIFLVLAPVLLIGVIAVALVLFDWLKISDQSLRAEGQWALMIVGLMLAGRFSLGVVNHALAGLQRFDVLNALDILEEIFRVGTMAVLLWQGYGMMALAAAILGVNLIRQLAAFACLRLIEPDLKWNPRQFDRDRFRELFRYSKMSFGITLAWLVIFNSDSILLGLMTSTAAAGVYAPAAQLMLYLRHVINAIGIPLTPAISHLDARSDDGGVARTYLTGLKYVSYVSFFLSTGVILFARPFVALWLPVEFASTAEVMMILAVGSAVFLPQIIGNSVLFGIERHRYLFYVLLCEAVLKIGLSLLLIQEYGALGMAVAAAAPQVVLYLTLYPYFMSKVLGHSVGSMLTVSIRSGIIALVATAVTGLILRSLLFPDTWGIFAIEILVTALVAASIAWVFVFAKSDRDRIVAAVKGRIRRTG